MRGTTQRSLHSWPWWWGPAAAVVAVLALLAAIGACSGGDDDDAPRPGDGSASEPDEDDEANAAPAADGDLPELPDLSQELATSTSEDGGRELVVNDVRQDGDQVTVWVTIANVDDEEYDFFADLTDPSLGAVDENSRGDVSGMYIVDWNASEAYFPMSIGEGEETSCLCSRVFDQEIEPEESISVFAVYNGVGDLEDATLVVPGFLPADGLSPA